MAPKPLSTDEFFDRIWSRPVATMSVAVLKHTPITANQITIIATFFGIGIGVGCALGNGLLAAGCILGYLAFDCADGQMARVRGGSGYIGRAVDGVGDYISAVAMHVGLAIWMANLHGPVVGPVWAVTAGISAAWASFLLDRYKRRYRDDMDDPEVMRKEAEEVGGYLGYFIAKMIPYSRRLAGGIAVPDLAAYQERVRTPMFFWLLNGPTMHFLSMAILYTLDKPLWYCWLAIGPMNLLSIGTLIAQLKLERRKPAVVVGS